MKAIYQSFHRGSIPLSYPVNIVTEDNYTDEPVDRLNTPRVLCLSLLSAAIAAVFAQCMLLFINAITQLAYFMNFSVEEVNPAYHDLDLLAIGIPVIGALIAVLLFRFCITKERMECGCYFIDPFCSGVYIGTGVPLGIEGAVFMNSYLFSNFTKEKWRTTYPERRVLAAAGIVSGIAYLFGSPLAAVALVLELLLVECTLPVILPLILAAATGAFFRYLYCGMVPAFVMPEVSVTSGDALLGYTITGLITGLVAVSVKKLITLFAWLFRRIPIQPTFRPLLAAFLIGVIAYFAPQMLGTGQLYISDMLMGKVTLQLLFVVGIVKVFSWTLAAGSGTPGGTIVPLAAMGAAFGLFVTFILQFILPTVQLNYSVAALTGMAAMLSGAYRVLPAAILFAYETTHERNAIFPLICACVAAYLVSFLLSKRRINRETKSLLQSGIN